LKAKPRFLGSDYASQFQDESVAAVYRRRPPYPSETCDVLGELLPSAKARVLDVGSGTGEIAIPMAKRGAIVDAVEPSSAMLEVALGQDDSARVTWHNVDAESFGYPERYSLIVCAQSLGWLDWKLVFPAFAAALEPGGWLAIVGQRGFDDFPWQSDLVELISRYSTNQDFEPFQLINGLIERNLFERSGFRETGSIPFEQTIDDYIDSIHARNGFSRDRMAQQEAAAFDEAVRKLLSGQHPDGRLVGECRARITWGKPLG
jgi:SAM-dependent methyltransferase